VGDRQSDTGRKGDRQSGSQEGQGTGSLGDGQGGRQGDRQDKQYPGVRQPVGGNMLAQKRNQVLHEKGSVPCTYKRKNILVYEG
jgi:hypothetical protein